MMPEKKSFVLLIVEGRSDSIALDAPLNAAIKRRGLSQRIKVDIYGTDCLLHEQEQKDVGTFSDPWETIDRVKRAISSYLKQPKNKLTPKDISAVIVVSDLDGCYCAGDRILQNPNGIRGIHYDTQERIIYCDDVSHISCRNQHKVDALELILQENVIKVPGSSQKPVPLGMFYYNLNMEHVFYNVTNPLTDDDKIAKAKEFRSLYLGNPDGFMSFLSELNRIGSDYQASWNLPQIKSNPFLRTSNLCYIVEWIVDHIR